MFKKLHVVCVSESVHAFVFVKQHAPVGAGVGAGVGGGGTPQKDGAPHAVPTPLKVPGAALHAESVRLRHRLVVSLRQQAPCMFTVGVGVGAGVGALVVGLGVGGDVGAGVGNVVHEPSTPHTAGGGEKVPPSSLMQSEALSSDEVHEAVEKAQHELMTSAPTHTPGSPHASVVKATDEKMPLPT